MSSQPPIMPMVGHLAILQNDIFYTNEPPMKSHLVQKATFPISQRRLTFPMSQGWLLIAGYTVLLKNHSTAKCACLGR